MRVLVINTYGGSILLGARAAGAEIVGSYEDAGFGTDVQIANFPGVTVADTPRGWSATAQRDAVVLAHPPCSAFSMQNVGADEARGVDSEAFACTRRVAEYALGGKCAALAIESVPAALEGARGVHEGLAEKHGYALHRVLQNAIFFGAPQWRERFWAVFVRRDVAPETMHWSLSPVVRSLGDALGAGDPGPGPAECERDLEKLKRKLSAPLSREWVDELLATRTSDFSGSISELLASAYPGLGDAGAIHRTHVRGFTSRALRFLAPGDYAPTLMSDSWWWYAGRQVSLSDYSRIMGFPADYAWPGKTSERRRLYLSKGVVPAVARWVYDSVVSNLGGEPADDSQIWVGDAEHRRVQNIKPGEVALFRGARNQWRRFLETGEPPFREE